MQRGIASREAGGSSSSSNSHRRPVHSETRGVVVNLSNVHTLTTYELRQELKQRGTFLDDYDEGPVNYQILLQELVHHLKEETDEMESCRIQYLYHSQQMNLKEKLQMDKERRKADSMERSRLRQTNTQYFANKKKKSLNTKVEIVGGNDGTTTVPETQNNDKVIDNTEKENHLDNVSNSPSQYGNEFFLTKGNPFRSSSRFKIGGKFA